MHDALPAGPLATPPPPTPLRLGLIGAGRAGITHLKAAAAHPERVRFVAIADPHATVARDLVGDTVTTLTDYRPLLDGRLDAVVIAVPHDLHLPIARDFLAAGIPVLLEKPIARDLAEARALHDLARARGVLLAIAHNKRFLREALWLRHWIAADPRHFGALRTFDLRLWQNIACNPHYRDADTWMLDAQRAGGGAVISIAIHQLDLLRFLTGLDYTEVVVHGRQDPPFRGGGDSAVVGLLRLSNGASGVLHVNLNAPRVPHCEQWTLFGEHGTILREAVTGKYEGPLRYASAAAPNGTGWRQMYDGFQAVPVAELAASGWTESAFENQLLHFAEAVRHGARPLNDVAGILNTMACVQAIHDSLRTGRPTPVPA